MNIPEFIGQTYKASTYPIDDILRFFDHSMAIYDIVKQYNVTGVCGITDSNHYMLQMQIMTSNPSYLANIVNYINYDIHNRKNIYGKVFRIDAQSMGNCANLYVQECR